VIDQFYGPFTFGAELAFVEGVIFEPLHFGDPTLFNQNIHPAAVVTNRAIGGNPF